MKKYTILMLALLISAVLPVSAELTVNDVSSPEYLINHGHSETTTISVERSKAAANGVDYQSIDEEPYYESNSFLRILNKAYTYIDPAANQDTFMNHDIRVTPSVNDL